MFEYAISIPLTVAFVNAVLAVFILFGKRDLPGRVYGVFVFFVALWCASIGFFYFWEGSPMALVAANFNYVAAPGHILLFLIFTKVFPRKQWNWQDIVFASSPLLLFGVLATIDPNVLILELGSRHQVILAQPAYAIYASVALSYIAWAFWSLLGSFLRAQDAMERRQTGLVAMGTTLAYVVALLPNLILPGFGNFTYIWIGTALTLIMTFSIGYAITKHHLFNVKIIATQLLTFGLWLFILIRTLLATTTEEQLIDSALLVITIVVGILLIRSVIDEVETREKVEVLAKDLEIANLRLKELDQQKSEFVSIASHQLRSPLTAIKGYVSMLLEDTPSYGNIHQGTITAGGIEALSRVMKSANNLVAIIEDLLNISRIEQGRMQYTMSDFDLTEMARELVENLAINAKERGLTITFDAAEESVMITADSGKVRQVINNVIDNSIKYTPAGSIAVTLSATHEGRPLLAIKDTGIGISQDNIGKLFQKFSRASGAGKVNVTGTGIGLFIAQEIMKAHNGRIWVESPGEGKGSTFFVEF